MRRLPRAIRAGAKRRQSNYRASSKPQKTCKKVTIGHPKIRAVPIRPFVGPRNSTDVLAIVAPGQGAQTPGFLSSWLEVPTFADRLNWLSAVSGLDLSHYGTDADAETIRDTAIAQPLLVAAGLLAALELFPHPADGYQLVGVVAGHSVGEITAAAGVGVLSAEQAMVFVRERGRAMAEASAATPTSMTAVIGGDPDEVLAALEAHGLTAANNNGSGQIVAAGTKEQLAALAATPPARARLIELSVAGAFHTVHMQPAVARLGGTRAGDLHPRPANPPAVERRWAGRARWPGSAQAVGSPSRLAGALGSVYGRDG